MDRDGHNITNRYRDVAAAASAARPAAARAVAAARRSAAARPRSRHACLQADHSEFYLM